MMREASSRPLLKKNSSTCTTNSIGVLSSLSKSTLYRSNSCVCSGDDFVEGGTFRISTTTALHLLLDTKTNSDCRRNQSPSGGLSTITACLLLRCGIGSGIHRLSIGVRSSHDSAHGLPGRRYAP